MNAVGIDVSKSKSTIAIVRPFGEVVRMPFEIAHTTEELQNLSHLILSLDGETRVVMENTGRYHEPIANALHESGSYEQKSRRMSKQGSPHLRKALFQVMACVLQNKNHVEPVFQFLDRKRAEGKPYKVYMMAGANKFLRVYYARVNAVLNALELDS